jgi:hypothetical protein
MCGMRICHFIATPGCSDTSALRHAGRHDVVERLPAVEVAAERLNVGLMADTTPGRDRFDRRLAVENLFKCSDDLASRTLSVSVAPTWTRSGDSLSEPDERLGEVANVQERACGEAVAVALQLDRVAVEQRADRGRDELVALLAFPEQALGDDGPDIGTSG